MLSGALVGAGGATAYYNGIDVSGTVRSLLTGGQLRDLPNWQSSGSNGRELDALYKLVCYFETALCNLVQHAFVLSICPVLTKPSKPGDIARSERGMTLFVFEIWEVCEA